MEMGKLSFKIFIGAIFISLLPSLALANGFSINEQGSKALGMGGAFAAQADDPSAIYYNPAGITQLEGTQVSAGISLISPRATFNSDVTGNATEAEKNNFYIPNLYATHKVNDKWSFGVGAFSNFGLATEWAEDWEGRYVTGATKAEITTMSINPVVAYSLNPALSLSFGAVMQSIDIELQNKLNSSIAPWPADGNLKLSGDDWSGGWNAGLLLRLNENIKVGVSYRSKIAHTLEGETEVSGTPAGVLDALTGTEADLTLPAIFYFGTSYENGPWTFEADAHLTQWSEYKKLEATFDSPILGGATGISKPKDWEDVWALRFGGSYELNDMFDLRAGIVFDPSPIPDETLDPLVPSGDRWLYTIGTGINFEKATIDFAYNYMQDEGRTFDNAVGAGVGGLTGEFDDIYAHILTLNVSYAF
ncbi:MAG: outer membrane protein transport protein [Desulfobacterales bacterium]|nr:outer membrane protein transport protein [Desulfobacterales bacterium]